MLKVIGLFALVSLASAALYRWDPQPKPADFANQPGCYLAHLFRVLPYNVYFYPNTDCSRYFCKSDNVTLYETCQAVNASGSCRVTPVDMRNAFPYCCGRVVCDVTTPVPTTPTTPPTPTTPTAGPTTTPAPAKASAAASAAASGPNAQATATATAS